MQNNLPASYEFNDVNAGIEYFGVGASVTAKRCEGLNNLAIAEFNQGHGLDMISTNEAGETIVSFNVVLGINDVTCSGSASIDSLGLTVDMGATMSINDLIPQINGKLSFGGQTCLGVQDVAVELEKDMITWTNINVVDFEIPEAQAGWELLPIDGLFDMMNQMIADVLVDQMNTLSTELCF